MICAENVVLYRRKQQFVALTSKLDAMSPLKVLTRGYAMAQTAQGDVLRSVLQAAAGDSICVTVSDGTLSATVTSGKENGHE